MIWNLLKNFCLLGLNFAKSRSDNYNGVNFDKTWKMKKNQR